MSEMSTPAPVMSAGTPEGLSQANEAADRAHAEAVAPRPAVAICYERDGSPLNDAYGRAVTRYDRTVARRTPAATPRRSTTVFGQDGQGVVLPDAPVGINLYRFEDPDEVRGLDPEFPLSPAARASLAARLERGRDDQKHRETAWVIVTDAKDPSIYVPRAEREDPIDHAHLNMKTFLEILRAERERLTQGWLGKLLVRHGMR